MKAKFLAVVLALSMAMLGTVDASPWSVTSGKVPSGQLDSTSIDLGFFNLDFSAPKGWQGPANQPYPNTKIIFSDGYGTFYSTVVDRVYYVNDDNGTRLYLTVEGWYEGTPAVCYIGLSQYTQPVSYGIYLFLR